jgi:GNAT superfamily N-acetyltransferase
MLIREYEARGDAGGVRACWIELQEFERTLDARVPPGSASVDRYLDRLFAHCRAFDGRLFVAEREGQVLGFISVLAAMRSEEPDDDPTPYAYVADLVVLPDHRGGGLGRALLLRAERYARERGKASLRLRVKGGNQQARAFYATGGYSEYELELEKRF